METFNSKIDSWLLALLSGSALLCIVIAGLLLWQGGLAKIGLALFIILMGAGFPFWIVVTTKYIVAGEELKICSGPFSWTIPLSSIMSIRETKNPLSSPALSLDRLEIQYGNGKSIMISPVNQSKFRAAIGHEKNKL